MKNEHYSARWWAGPVFLIFLPFWIGLSAVDFYADFINQIWATKNGKGKIVRQIP